MKPRFHFLLFYCFVCTLKKTTGMSDRYMITPPGLKFKILKKEKLNLLKLVKKY